ncbi:MAG: hypothetical protein KDD02_18580 [Phaeodactylibacter sp.]|nr:hypothetical protein [Phaeodactylibacter sp.]MCB9300714.1 hypothetical protein [Lewinellaceae bacterium]HQU59665.1 hypothetical protein [Saprospiraceae bacterium]
MKQLIVFSVALLAAAPLLAQFTSDIEAAKVLLAKESQYFYQRNFDAWANCYVQDERVRWSCIEKGDVVLEAYGWDKLGPFVGDYLKANPEPIPVQLRRENFQFQPYGEALWVTFDEYQTLDGQTKALRGVRILEKAKGQWKIIYMNSYPMP